MSTVHFCLISALLLVSCQAKLTIRVNETNTVDTIVAPLEFKQTPDYSLVDLRNVPCVVVNASEALPEDRSAFAGKLAVMSNLIVPWSVMIDLQSAGVIAIAAETVPYFSSAVGSFMYYSYSNPSDQLVIPMVEIGAEAMVEIFAIANSTSLRANLSIDPAVDVNEWKTVYGSGGWILWQVILVTYGVVIFTLAFLKLCMLFKEGIRTSVATVSLLMICVSCLLRIVYVGVNPLMSRQAWEGQYDDFLFTISMPFSLAPVFLMSLYFQQALNRKGVQSTDFVLRFKVVFFIFISLFVAFELITSILRVLQIDARTVIIVNVVVYILVALFLLVLFIVTAVMLGKRLRQSDEMSYKNSASKMTKKATIYSVVTSISLLLFIAAGTCLADDSLSARPVSLGTLFFLCYFALYTTSLIHVMSYFNLTRGSSSQKQRSGSSI